MKYYFKHKVENLVVIKNIVTIEYLDLYPGFNYPLEQHDFWEMIYADKDTVVCIKDTVAIDLNEGELLFLHPNQQHRLEAPLSAPSIFVLCFDCSSHIMPVFSNYKIALSAKQKHIISDIVSETKSTFKLPFKEKLELLPNANLGGQQAIRVNLELLLISLLRNETTKYNPNTEFIKNIDFADDITNTICTHLQENIYGNIHLPEICKLTHYSKSYLTQLFKQTTKMSIITYFNNLKIKEAQRLIREKKYTMVQISQMLSFSDPRYFSVMFKKIVGKSPIQYKNSIYIQT